MQTDQIIAECVARKKLAPGKTAVQLVDEVLTEVAGYRAAIAARPEYAMRPETRAQLEQLEGPK